MEDIYKLIDDINLQKLENLDSRVNEAITTDNDDALFILERHFTIWINATRFGSIPRVISQISRRK